MGGGGEGGDEVGRWASCIWLPDTLLYGRTELVDISLVIDCSASSHLAPDHTGCTTAVDPII